MKYKILTVMLSAVMMYCCAASTSSPSAVYHTQQQNAAEAGSCEADVQVQSGKALLLRSVPTEFEPKLDIIAKPISADDETAPTVTSKKISLKAISQMPELPTGCEVTSLAVVLNYMGYDADKLTLARDYLPKLGFYRKKGVLYGADFRTTFAGDPESKRSYGCYAPCITETANRYLEDAGSDSKAYDISGAELEALFCDYIDNDIPVMIWITSDGLHEPKPTTVWITPKGEEIQWIAYEHCVVLIGYDMEQDTVCVADPLYGITSYDFRLLKQRYTELGSQAVYIEQ